MAPSLSAVVKVAAKILGVTGAGVNVAMTQSEGAVFEEDMGEGRREGSGAESREYSWASTRFR